MTQIFIASPALRSANNGNWRTAHRWSTFLRNEYQVSCKAEWDLQRDLNNAPSCLIALHARRSASSIASFASACPGRPLIVVLTGTDLYRDIHCDESARLSLELATYLVVLQDEGPMELAAEHRVKCRVIYQSAPDIKQPRSVKGGGDTFDVVLVGHMRAEKDPLTPMRALEWLPDDSRVRLIHIGKALEDKYRLAVEALLVRQWPAVRRYVWLAGLPHVDTLRQISQAQLMVISSVMEGGAHVIIEAVKAGIPILASRVPGNVGMLGRDYSGYFTPGDDRELSHMLERASREEAFLAGLRRQCVQRAPLFDPEREKNAITQLLKEALA
jgi:putative glycosyltransferase (TIGR04348 family)